MKSLLAAVLATCLFLCAPTFARANTDPTVINTVEAQTVIIFGNIVDSYRTVYTEHDSPYCSGVDIGTHAAYDVILTARHCVHTTTDEGEVYTPIPTSVKFSDGDHYSVVSYSYALNDDLGLIYISSTKRPHATINAAGLVRGEDYFIFGMPYGYTWSYSPAWSLQGDTYTDDPSPTWKDTELIACVGCGPGDSGGGLFDEFGNLVGIVVGGGNGTEALIEPASRMLLLLTGKTLAPESLEPTDPPTCATPWWWAYGQS